jgi:hypothetical protein
LFVKRDLFREYIPQYFRLIVDSVIYIIAIGIKFYLQFSVGIAVPRAIQEKTENNQEETEAAIRSGQEDMKPAINCKPVRGGRDH